MGFGFHDTGLDCAHPDLTPNIDLAFSKNFVGGDICNPWLAHGTYMAGMAARRNNNIGIAGIWDAPFFMLSTARPDPENTPPEVQPGDHVIAMFSYTLGMPYDLVVLNDSSGVFSTDQYGGFVRLRPELQSLQNKTLIFFSAGNLIPGITFPPPDITLWPGILAQISGCNDSDLPNVICMGSLDAEGNMSAFSYYGPKVTMGAIGEMVFTTCPMFTCPTGYTYEGWIPPGYTAVYGTSGSSALAASATADRDRAFLRTASGNPSHASNRKTSGRWWRLL